MTPAPLSNSELESGGKEAEFGVSRTAPRKRPRVGVVLTWPEIKNAEYEVIQRIIQSGQNIGVDVIIIDNDGYPLWTKSGIVERNASRVEADDVDFIISLHFESPRLYDVFSYSALWNPLEFFFMFGYDGAIERSVSHNDLLSCKSELADAQALSSLAPMGRAPAGPLPELFHSMGEPFLEPNIGPDSRLFYIGINWERMRSTKGRYHDLLVRLDSENLINIYGPETFQGIQPWEGFQNYKGSIPFDGVSVLSEINRAGICLSISSAAHKASGIMSSRLFEGFAAGAVIIASSHPIIEKHFSDCVYVVDDRLEPEELAARVRRLVLDIRSDPKPALEMARRGQQRLRDYFSMDVRLKALVDQHPGRVKAFQERVWGAPQSVCVIATCTELDWSAVQAMASNCKRQKNVRLDVVLIADEALITAHGESIEALFRGDAVNSLQVVAAELFEPQRDIAFKAVRRVAVGPLIHKLMPTISAEYFCFLRPEEYWFSDHLTSMANALAKMPSSYVARSGSIVEFNVGASPKNKRRIESLSFGVPENFIYANDPRNSGRSLFRTALIKKMPLQALELLDGQEHNLFAAHAFMSGPVAQTSYATYVFLEAAEALALHPTLPVEQQHQFIRDTLTPNAERRNIIAGINRPTSFVFATSSGAPIRWADYRQEGEPGRAIERNHLYATCLGGDGAEYLGSGFSGLEDQLVWVEGDQAEITFSVPDTDGDLELVLDLVGRPHTASGRAQHCTLTLNNFVLGYFRVAGRLEQRVQLNPKLYQDVDSWKLRLLIDHAENFSDQDGGIIDPRLLGLQLRGFGVFDRR